MLKSRPVYLDTETTGLGPNDEIVEICLIDHRGETLLDTLIRPKRPIPGEAIRIHRITQQMVRDAPTWPEVYPELQRFLSNRVVAAYNADFDKRMMLQSCFAHRVPWTLQSVEWFCLMKLYAKFFGRWDDFRGDFRWHSLERAGRQMGIPLPNRHRARDDALLAKAILGNIAGNNGLDQ